MTEENWVKDAMSDDTLVADMLVRLKQAEPFPIPTPTPVLKTSPALQLEWSVRQPRSKQLLKNKGKPTRASPTTPLSLSGPTTSFSGGAGPGAADVGFEESSRPVDNPRSKVVGTSETTTTKKARKKRTLAELKEEEDSLLKEKSDLKNQLASLHESIEKQRAENENLKKMKVDVVPHPVIASPATEDAISNQPHKMEVDCDPSLVIIPANGAINELNPSESNNSKFQEDETRMPSFMVPDLNLSPMEEDDSGSWDLYGIS